MLRSLLFYPVSKCLPGLLLFTSANVWQGVYNSTSVGNAANQHVSQCVTNCLHLNLWHSVRQCADFRNCLTRLPVCHQVPRPCCVQACSAGRRPALQLYSSSNLLPYIFLSTCDGTAENSLSYFREVLQSVSTFSPLPSTTTVSFLTYAIL